MVNGNPPLLFPFDSRYSTPLFALGPLDGACHLKDFKIEILSTGISWSYNERRWKKAILSRSLSGKVFPDKGEIVLFGGLSIRLLFDEEIEEASVQKACVLAYKLLAGCVINSHLKQRRDWLRVHRAVLTVN